MSKYFLATNETTIFHYNELSEGQEIASGWNYSLQSTKFS